MAALAAQARRFGGTYAGKRVLVTGDTGFKGAWLVWWLRRLGAEVTGVGLPPPTDPSLFALAGLDELVEHREIDLRDGGRTAAVIAERRPEVVFHLAAQSIVRESYVDPVGTFATNVMGTVHVLDAVRRAGQPCAVVVVTTDKAYENRGTDEPYREDERFGGHDPYSASKGGSEIVASSYRRSFFAVDRLAEHGVAVATARAGNVIGPGDWAKDRLVPDCVRALAADRPIRVRNPASVRPWQHVLESLSGYLWLGTRLLGPAEDAATYCEGWNFGPQDESSRTVADMVAELCACWGDGRWEAVGSHDQPHEAALLRLSIDKAAARGWRPVWGFDDTVRRTAIGYRGLAAADGPAAIRALLDDELDLYAHHAAELGLAWAQDGQTR